MLKQEFIMKTMDFVAGYTVSQALTKACNAAAHERQTILIEINDIMMLVGKDDNPKNLLKKYIKKLDFKYEIEKIKRQRQK